MVSEFNPTIFSYHELNVITSALTVYHMYLYEDYDKEDNAFLKNKLRWTINDVERVMKELLKIRWRLCETEKDD